MGQIIIKGRKSSPQNLRKKFSTATIFDITSKAEDPESVSTWASLSIPGQGSQPNGALLSPFHPHGGIPIPNSPDEVASSVEGIWQGLKVFEYEGISWGTLRNLTGLNIKRSVRKHGLVKGHQYGTMPGSPLLDYIDARFYIYLPTYRWMLEHIASVSPILDYIREELKQRDVVLLDYNTNTDIYDCSRPLSHAGLVKLFIEGNYPDCTPEEYALYRPLSEQRTLSEQAKKEGKSRSGKAKTRNTSDSKGLTETGDLFGE